MHSIKGQIPQRMLNVAIIICIGLLFLSFIGITTAKFVSKTEGNDNASVAYFSPALNSVKIDITEITIPGNSTEKSFTVQNYSDDELPEVAMKYKIILKTTGNLPLKFTVIDGEENDVFTCSCDGISGEQEYSYEKASFIFKADEKGTHEYKLKVEWPEEQKDARFSGMTDAIYLAIEWEQID
ncbi:MAG: hypothetical protein ACI39R_00080 [Lachnospiraceae bacterium]